MQKFLQTIRYKLFGKQIQRALEMSEQAGREASDYLWKTRTLHAEATLKQFQEKRDLEIEQKVSARMAELNYAVDPMQVLKAEYHPQTGKTIAAYLGKERLNIGQIGNLKQEVQLIKNTQLYSIFMNTVKDQAQQIMFTKSKDFDDMRTGKAMLYNLDILDNIIKTIEGIDLKDKQVL